jgi:SpoVK/Ycf46/Vps4 family AAA+-type ATPase
MNTQEKTISELGKMIDVNTPIIYIHDYDFVRIDHLIYQAIGKRKVLEWNPATGTTNFFNKESTGLGKEQTLESFLYNEYIIDTKIEKFLVLKEIQYEIESSVIKTILLMMAQRRLYDKEYNTTIIIESTKLQIPEELRKYISFLEIPLPEEDEIRDLIHQHTKINHYDAFDPKDEEKLLPSLKGMSAFEIDRMLDMAMSRNGSLDAKDKEMILQQKKQMVKQSGLLELFNIDKKNFNEDSIGGLEVLKAYLRQKANIIRRWPEAQKANVAMPKGIFIVGMPGCGKSLCAKVASVMLDIPLLKLDMGTMMGKYVGESESNLREAIRIAEAAAPCILWVDEIEKALSGVGGEGSDVLTRMFGYLLSWLQEKESSVYVIATANSADKLPPELKRKGRFDEIFCVNLPNNAERRSIFEVKLRQKGKMDEVQSNLDELVKATEGYNGADIEAIVNEAIENCFIDAEKNLPDEMLRVAKETISISKSCKKQIDDMKKIFDESHFRDASKKN